MGRDPGAMFVSMLTPFVFIFGRSPDFGFEVLLVWERRAVL